MEKEFEYVDNIERYKKAAIELYKQKRIALDVETYAKEEYKNLENARLNPHLGRIGILTIAKEGSKPYVFDLIKLENEGYDSYILEQVIKSAGYVLIHNAVFDCGMLRGQFNLRLKNVRCTYIMAQILSNATGSRFGVAKGHGLSDLCRDLLDIHITGKGELQIAEWGIDIDKRELENPIWYEMLKYAANDVKYLFQLNDIMYKVLTNPLPSSPLINGTTKMTEAGLGQKEVLELEFKYIPVVVEKQYNGLPIAKEILERIQESIEYECIEAAVELCKELKLETYYPDLESQELPTPKTESIFNNPKKMLDIIKKQLRVEVGNTSTQSLERVVELIDTVYSDNNVETINDKENQMLNNFEKFEQSILETNSNIVKGFLKYKKLKKQMSMNLKDYINPATEKIHSRYNQLGTATGRLCVAKGELVLTTEKGLVPINDIEIGDLVFCYTFDNQLVSRPVTNVWNKGVQETLQLLFINTITEEETVLRCTPDHLLKLESGGWIEAKDLFEGIEVLGAKREESSRFLNICTYVLDKQSKARDITVYDIEVKDYHNFIASNICCHNSSSGPNVQQISARLYTTIKADVEDLNSYV